MSFKKTEKRILEKTRKPVRYLYDISEDELIKAVADMCRTLNIAGSTLEYDLYEAAARERLKAIENLRKWRDLYEDMEEKARQREREQ